MDSAHNMYVDVFISFSVFFLRELTLFSRCFILSVVQGRTTRGNLELETTLLLVFQKLGRLQVDQLTSYSVGHTKSGRQIKGNTGCCKAFRALLLKYAKKSSCHHLYMG